MSLPFKVFAQGWPKYWKEGWNKFDFILALIAIIEVGLTSLSLNFIRALRVLRAVKLLRYMLTSKMKMAAKAGGAVKGLMDVLVTAIPGFANVGALILLVIYIYAYIGVNVFGKLVWNEGEGGINEHVNVSHLLSSYSYPIARKDAWRRDLIL